jgi:hypothetical protein
LNGIPQRYKKVQGRVVALGKWCRVSVRAGKDGRGFVRGYKAGYMNINRIKPVL